MKRLKFDGHRPPHPAFGEDHERPTHTGRFTMRTEERAHPRQPVHALMLAVLEEAIETYQRCRGSNSQDKRLLTRRATRWFLSNDRSWLFSFLTICDTLDINPETIRNGLFGEDHRKRDWAER